MDLDFRKRSFERSCGGGGEDRVADAIRADEQNALHNRGRQPLFWSGIEIDMGRVLVIFFV